MSRLLRTLNFVVRSAIVGLAAAFLLILLVPGAASGLRARLGGEAATVRGPALLPGASPISYADAVDRTAPSVVSVYVSKVVTERPILFTNPTMQRFSGMTLGPTRQRLQQAQGSGVIVDPEGYIITNHHVIDDADEIQIVLQDGRVTRARVVGSDADTDVGVLKVEGNNLVAMPLIAHPEVRVGDVVLAIGNPLGSYLGQTVTQGIVSGLGRNQLGLTTYDNFIQTDAAINEGNSGGALINARGQLIGINAFTLGRRVAGMEGIGLAIPSSTVKAVFDQIVDHGLVVRGWMGVEYGDAPVLPGALGAGTPRGVALTKVFPDSPADRAGLLPGDVLLQVGGQDVVDQSDLREREAALQPGSTVRLEGLRAGVPFSADLVLTQRPSSRA
jgi:serine protease DegQ